MVLWGWPEDFLLISATLAVDVGPWGWPEDCALISMTKLLIWVSRVGLKKVSPARVHILSIMGVCPSQNVPPLILSLNSCRCL